jgi:hypothetical protein
LFGCGFPQYKPDIPSSYTSGTEDAIVDHTCSLLSRLPPIPLPLVDAEFSPHLTRISQHYLLRPEAPGEWSNLKVVPHISTPVVLLALVITAATNYHKEWELEGIGSLRALINTFIEFLEVCSTLSSTETSTANAEAWMIVRSYLWVSWQRCTMLVRWYMLGLHLERGFAEINDGFSLRQYTHSGVEARAHDQGLLFYEVPQYMCKWAFRLLRSDRSAVCQDFRRLCAIFDEAFPGRRPRCILNSTTIHLQCDGSSTDNCQRFKGLIIADQSAHAEEYGSLCQPLYWNEESYRSVNGARAVVLDELLPAGPLNYCAASEETLAISHVWSHGQGGRPETSGTGLNSCLHRRYSRLARALGCTSYWMDTPCIPQDHQLRAEAISCINQVFARSKVTLICDRDLMDIDVEESPNETKTYQTILAVLLVCDWNVRAWTFLESMRGRRHVHVLCKNDKVVSVKRALEVVHKFGYIDIAVLVFTSQHLLPWLDRSGPSIPGYDPDLLPLPIPEATCLLVNRHASRPGDDVVIWTLLAGPKPFFDPIDFWKEAWRKLVEIRTGFLMSDIPRLQHTPGLRWAPSQPRLANSIGIFTSSTAVPPHVYAPSEQVYDGINSRYGRILPGGALEAVWYVYEFIVTSSSSDADSLTEDKTLLERQQVLNHIATLYKVFNSRSRLIRPASAYPGSENFTVLYQGKAGGPLVAVVSHLRGQAWKWEGLYEWPVEVELPIFDEQFLRIV